MWSRSQIKDRAKWVLKQCYWKVVLMCLILSFTAAGGSYVSVKINLGRYGGGSYGSSLMGNGDMRLFGAMLGAIAAASFVFAIAGTLIGIFLFLPLEVSIRRFFIISRVQPAELNELGFSFKNNYWNVVKVQFLRKLFITLWTFLLVVPGLIKTYEYRMIPYILAENPGMDRKEVFQISRDMMYGEKWKTFVLDLSFLGWTLLSCFTCGILNIFYVNPYINLTEAELYDALKCKLFGNGSIDRNGMENFSE